jgi:hypothetical protein
MLSCKCEALMAAKDLATKLDKGVWGMPRLSEAMKDAISCEKLWGGAHNL